MGKKPIQLIFAFVVVVVAAVWAYHNASGPSQKFDLTPYNALGAGVAGETAKLLGGKGQVVVVAPDTSEFKDPVMDGQLATFEQEIKRSGVTIAGTAKFKLTAMERMGSGGAVPSAFLAKAVQDHSSAGVVVLFCPFPADYSTAKSDGPKFIVASSYLPSYRKLLESRAIAAAIVPKFDRSAPAASKPKTLQESFEEEFLVITPGNLTSLPY